MLLHCPAPAKLNYFLHVTGRREDGMHLLQSAFVLIDLMDLISIGPAPQGEIIRTGDIIGEPEHDLCVKAARLLQQHTGCTQGCHIHVQKRIPAGAGMGGGSSDAATTLIALNQFWGCQLSRQTLMQLGLQLGADVPFFLFGQNAWVEGIGEKMQALSMPTMTFDVIWPGVNLPTGKIFSHPLLTRDSKSITMSVFTQCVGHQEAELRNDLQAVAQVIEPAVRQALLMLPPTGHPRMTGSGSAVFAKSESNTIMCFHSLPPQWQGFHVKMLTEHPLRGWLTD